MKKIYTVISIILFSIFITACKTEKETTYQVIDVFQYVNVTVSGIAPYVKAQLEVSELPEWMKDVEYYIDKTEGIKNDDVITVTCSLTDEKANEAGYRMAARQKIYYVKDVDQYINSTDQLENELMGDIINEEAEVICKDTENTEDRMLYRLTGKANYLFQYNKEWVEGAEVKDIFLLTPMNYNDETLEKNIIYVVLKAVVSNSDYSEEGYFFFRYDNGIITKDNTLYLNHQAQETRYYCESDYDELYNMLIAPLTQNYYIGNADTGNFTVNIENNRNEN